MRVERVEEPVVFGFTAKGGQERQEKEDKQ
jgi:hypothetical protein